MPAQDRLRPDDEQRLPPVLHPAREHDEEGAIGARAVWSFTRAVEHDELLAQQVFGDQLRFTACQISDRADPRRVGERFAPAREDAPDDPFSTPDQGLKTISKELQHQRDLFREWDSAFRLQSRACRRLYQPDGSGFDAGAVGRGGAAAIARNSCRSRCG